MSSLKYSPVRATVSVAAVIILGVIASYLTSMSDNWSTSIGFGLWVFIFVFLLGIALSEVDKWKKPAKTRTKSKKSTR